MWLIIEKFIGNILIVTGVFLFSRIVLNKPIQLSKLRTITDLLLTALAYTIIMSYFNGTIKTLLMMVTLFIFNKDVFKENFRKTIFITCLYTLLLLILDIAVLLFVTEILNISKEYCYKVFAGSIICNLLVQLSTVITTCLLKHILRKILNTKIETNTQIIIFSLMTLICSTMFLYTIVREFEFSNNIFLYLLSISVLIAVLFSLIKQTIKNNRLTSKYDKLLEFMTTYENEIEKQRILRHEIKNEFRTIRAKICDNQENQEIIEYIDEIVKDKYKMKQEEYAKFGYLPANGIKGLCYFKVQEAETKGIKVAVNISKGIKESAIYKLNIKQQRDFGRILGVILDNAIEASLETKKKQLGIEAYISKEKEFRLIITNTYNNTGDKNKIGKERYSTKGKTRGHGLLLVKKLVASNSIFEIKTEIQEKIYVQTIIIKPGLNY